MALQGAPITVQALGTVLPAEGRAWDEVRTRSLARFCEHSGHTGAPPANPSLLC